MDNCYRECKNRYILGFCALLVKKGIFKEVRLFRQKLKSVRPYQFPTVIVSQKAKYCTLNVMYLTESTSYVCNLQVQLLFLMVGHTHEDVDQVVTVTLVTLLSYVFN